LPDRSVNYNFKQLSASSCKKSKQFIIDSFVFYPSRGDREKALLSQIFSDASLGNTKIVSVVDDTKMFKGSLGLVALSVQFKYMTHNHEWMYLRLT